MGVLEGKGILGGGGGLAGWMRAAKIQKAERKPARATNKVVLASVVVVEDCHSMVHPSITTTTVWGEGGQADKQAQALGGERGATRRLLLDPALEYEYQLRPCAIARFPRRAGRNPSHHHTSN